MRRILIETKAGGENGMGHVVRMSHLARELRENAEVSFLIHGLEGENYLKNQGLRIYDGSYAGCFTDYVQDFPYVDDDRLSEWSQWANTYVVVGVGWSVTKHTRLMTDCVFYQGVAMPRDEILSTGGGEVRWGLQNLILAKEYETVDKYAGEGVLMYVGGGIPQAYGDEIYRILTDLFELDVIRLSISRWSYNSFYQFVAESKVVVCTMGMAVYEAIRLEKPVVCFSRSHDHAKTAEMLTPRIWHGGLYGDIHPATICQIALASMDGKEYSQYKDLDGLGTRRVAERILDE